VLPCSSLMPYERQVLQARKKDDSQIYAIKVLQKQNIINRNQVFVACLSPFRRNHASVIRTFLGCRWSTLVRSVKYWATSDTPLSSGCITLFRYTQTLGMLLSPVNSCWTLSLLHPPLQPSPTTHPHTQCISHHLDARQALFCYGLLRGWRAIFSPR
jgi:hypothetical protein